MTGMFYICSVLMLLLMTSNRNPNTKLHMSSSLTVSTLLQLWFDYKKSARLRVIFSNSDIFITVTDTLQTVLMSSSTRWRRTVPNTLKCVKRSTSRFCHRKHKWVYLEIHVAWSGRVFYCLWPCFMGHLCRCLPVITQRPSRASIIRTVRTEIRRWRWSPIRS